MPDAFDTLTAAAKEASALRDEITRLRAIERRAEEEAAKALDELRAVGMDGPLTVARLAAYERIARVERILGRQIAERTPRHLYEFKCEQIVVAPSKTKRAA